MRIIVAPPDPAWPARYTVEAGRVQAALAPILIDLHHIGSTSIPGIFAKPVIDMLAEIHSPEAADGCAGAMRDLGYEIMGEFGIPGRRFFRKNNPEGVREFHVHAFRAGSPGVERHLAFRDYLRMHPEVARTYSELKQRLARENPDSMPAYTGGKHAYVQETERLALEWRRKKSRDRNVENP